MYEGYRARCAEGAFRPGEVFVWTEGDKVIFNLGTQRSWRTKAEIAAVEKSLWRMIQIAEEKGITRIGLPRIGAGLGGLDWEVIRASIERIGSSTPVTLIVFEVFEPGEIAVNRTPRSF